MTLPFLRQYPNRRALSELDGLPIVVENIGREFIAKGGVYLTEIQRDGSVRVAACIEENGKQKDVEVIVCQNGPAMLPEIVRLVVASIKHVKHRKLVHPVPETAH